MRDALGRIDKVLVLGGGSDIGQAIARLLVRARGARRVILAGRDEDAMRRSAHPIETDGATVSTVRFDATATDEHARIVDDIWATHGDINVVVLAFGVLGDQSVDERDAGAALEVIDVNYRGAVSVLIEVAARLETQGHGSLVVLSTVAAVRARRANFVYGSTKAGLDAFAEGLGDRLAGTGAHVLVVRPGFVHSRMTQGMDPAPFATTPLGVARDVVRGLDRGAASVSSPPPVAGIAAVLRNLPRVLVRRLPA